jgi:hypothetical protein
MRTDRRNDYDFYRRSTGFQMRLKAVENEEYQEYEHAS